MQGREERIREIMHLNADLSMLRYLPQKEALERYGEIREQARAIVETEERERRAADWRGRDIAVDDAWERNR